MPAFGYDLYMIAFDLCVSYIIQSVQAETLKKQVEPQLYHKKNHFLVLTVSFLLSLKDQMLFPNYHQNFQERTTSAGIGKSV